MESVERFREERVLEKFCEAEGRRSDDVEVGRKEVAFIVLHFPQLPSPNLEAYAKRIPSQASVEPETTFTSSLSSPSFHQLMYAYPCRLHDFSTGLGVSLAYLSVSTAENIVIFGRLHLIMHRRAGRLC